MICRQPMQLFSSKKMEIIFNCTLTQTSAGTRSWYSCSFVPQSVFHCGLVVTMTIPTARAQKHFTSRKWYQIRPDRTGPGSARALGMAGVPAKICSGMQSADNLKPPAIRILVLHSRLCEDAHRPRARLAGPSIDATLLSAVLKAVTNLSGP